MNLRSAAAVALSLALCSAVAHAAQHSPLAASAAPGGSALSLAGTRCEGIGQSYGQFQGATGPIGDLTSQTFNCVVSGLDPFMSEVKLTTSIQHSRSWDLELWLTSPQGTSVLLVDGAGGALADAFDGTLWDDSAPQSHWSLPVPVAPYATLAPMIGLSNFAGQTPNGTWTLTVIDDLLGHVGMVNGWTLEITTLDNPPAVIGGIGTSLANIPIPDFATTTDTIDISGLGSTMISVLVYTEITHTFNADLSIDLIAPSGTTVRLVHRAGSDKDDVFNGTLWSDDSTDLTRIPYLHTYTNGVVVSDLCADGGLAAFYGEDPNGTWTLRIADQIQTDVGTLVRWDLTLFTCADCYSNVTNYCTSSLTTNGCVPSLSASSPRASLIDLDPFVLTCGSVEGQKSGLIFYGTNGAISSPWGGLSSSFLCVKSPTQRMNAQNSGGTSGACDGALSVDFFAWFAANPTSLGAPAFPGQHFNAQTWFRDPPAPKTTNLSDAIEFDICP